MYRSEARSMARILVLMLAGMLMTIVLTTCTGRQASPGNPDSSGTDEATGDAIAPEPPPTHATDPETEAAGSAWFEEVAMEAGIDFVHRSGHSGRLLFPEMQTGGAALFDMDGDGDLDLYLVQGGEIGPAGSSTTIETATEAASGASLANSDRLYRNRLVENGELVFEDVTGSSGILESGYGMGVAAGDADNDGDVDLYVTNLGPNALLRNDGEGRFTQVPTAAGAAGQDWSSSAAFLDYDADGWLDLFVVNYVHWSIDSEHECFTDAGRPDYCGPNSYAQPAQDRLYHNLGDGSFEDVSQKAGLGTAFGNGLGVVPGDFDGDGRIDVFVANDGLPDQLWRNRGDGTFEDMAPLWGVAVDESGRAKAGMGTAAEDVDGDGDLDLLVVNLMGESDSLYRNEGDYFVDATASAGLNSLSSGFTRFGLGLVDFDNDGYLDIYQANGRVRWQSESWSEDIYAEPNLLLRGGADGRFVEVLPRGGTREPLYATSRAVVFGDVDNDGGVDVVVVNRDAPPYLLRNLVVGASPAAVSSTPAGHWLALRLLDRNGRDALGARLSLRAGPLHFTREVRSAYSYCAANDPRIHLGLGDQDKIESIEVRWVDGSVERFEPPAAVDGFLSLREGEGEGGP
jgi:hypothetical protein